MSQSKKKKTEMSAEELKRKMCQSFQSAGILNNFKGYLRQSVINELRGKYKEQTSPTGNSTDLLAATIKQNVKATWNQRVVDNLIVHHLKQSRYLYSLSLFHQESGITEYDESLTEELLSHLGASSNMLNKLEDKENNQSFSLPNLSSTPVATEKSSMSLIWKILSLVSSSQILATRMKEDSFREKKRPKPSSLADKLQAVDDEMNNALGEQHLVEIDYHQSIAILASATRRAEEAADKRAKEAFEHWKQIELAAMRVSEAEKTKEQIHKKAQELEYEYAKRKEALLLREKNAIERLNVQKESLEKDLYQQRQLLLCELEQFRIREKNLQERELMICDILESVKLKELGFMQREVLGQKKSNILHPTTVNKDQSLKRSEKNSVSSCAESLQKSSTGKEHCQSDEVLLELDSCSGEAEMLRRELETLKAELSETKSQLWKLTTDCKPSSQRIEISPRTDNHSSIRKRLDDFTRQLDDWKKQDKTKNETIVMSEIERWKAEVIKLSDTQDKLDEKHQQLEQMTSRIQARINHSPIDSSSPCGNLPSTSLCVFMDDITEEPSIRDYDSAHPAHVRWADEIPYSVQPNLVDGKRLSQYSPHMSENFGEFSTSSSDDLSALGLRHDIQNKFRTLEKESDDLEQMYMRYIQSNYKHVPLDIPAFRKTAIQVNNQTQMKYTVLTGPENLLESNNIQQKKSIEPLKDIVEHKDNLNQSRCPLELKKLGNERRLESASSVELSLATNSDIVGSLVLPKETKSSTHSVQPLAATSYINDYSPLSKVSTVEFINSGNLPVSSSSKLLDESKSISKVLESVTESNSDPDLTSTLPPIIRKRVNPPTHSVSDLQTGSDYGKFSSEMLPQDEMMESDLKYTKIKSSEENRLSDQSNSVNEELLSSSASEISDQLRKSFLNEGPQNSSFERPAFLEIKREELQHILETPDEIEVLKPNKEPEEQVKHDTKPLCDDSNLSLNLHDDDGIENILQSIDKSSARSIEGETDRGLAELLSQLGPNKGTADREQMFSGKAHDSSGTLDASQEPQPQGILFGRQAGVSISEGSLSGKMKMSDQKPVPENVLSDRSNTYSDQFLSSTESKTASEIKTMSDFEPSSTSVPCIDNKIAGMQQSDDEDKSGADANWSNLQLDRSGDISGHGTSKQEAQLPGNIHNGIKDVVDVFEASQSSHSIDAENKGENSSEDDFW